MTFEQLRVEHSLVGFDRFHELQDATVDRAWDCDLSAASLTIAELGSFTVDLLGTFNGQDGTFLWSWANPGAAGWPTRTVAASVSLQSRGGLFAERKFSAESIHPIELGALCSDLLGDRVLYLGPTGPGSVALLLIHGAPVASSKQPMVRWPRLFVDFQQVCALPLLRLCVERFLERSGLTLTRVPLQTEATDGKSSVTMHWDALGRIANIEMRLSG